MKHKLGVSRLITARPQRPPASRVWPLNMRGKAVGPQDTTTSITDADKPTEAEHAALDHAGDES